MKSIYNFNEEEIKILDKIKPININRQKLAEFLGVKKRDHETLSSWSINFICSTTIEMQNEELSLAAFARFRRYEKTDLIYFLREELERHLKNLNGRAWKCHKCNELKYYICDEKKNISPKCSCGGILSLIELNSHEKYFIQNSRMYFIYIDNLNLRLNLRQLVGYVIEMLYYYEWNMRDLYE